MKILSVFNNKGGVGKSTLSFHLGCALGELGKKVLFVDLDPQCNLTINAMFEDDLEAIWKEEDPFIDDYAEAMQNSDFKSICQSTRSIHFLLKPTEDGLNEQEDLSPAKKIFENVFLIPGRLSIHKYESKISERWNGLYQGDSLSIRTVNNIRSICERYAKELQIDYVIIDTSPSLGILNKTIISTVDGFIIPTYPDMFSLYGIKNIGNSLELWQKEFDTIFNLISKNKIAKFPTKFVQFIGFTIYNAKKYTANKHPNKYNLADAHYMYASKIPLTVKKYIKKENIANIPNIDEPIGVTNVMYTHNTFPSVAQGLKCPMWLVPEKYNKLRNTCPQYLKTNKITWNAASAGQYEATKNMYCEFAKDLIKRAEAL